MLDEILYIEGMGNYRMIHTVTQKIMTLQTFTDFEQELPPSLLCRVHKSYMVTSAKIDSAVIPISDSYWLRFFSLIGQAWVYPICKVVRFVPYF